MALGDDAVVEDDVGGCNELYGAVEVSGSFTALAVESDEGPRAEGGGRGWERARLPDTVGMERGLTVSDGFLGFGCMFECEV